MSEKKQDLIISASAAVAALNSLAYVANNPQDNTKNRIHVAHAESIHQGAIDDVLSNNGVQMHLRTSMPQILRAMDIEEKTMQDAWEKLTALDIQTDSESETGIIRIAQAQTGQIYDGNGIGVGKLIGPGTDSTVRDSISDKTGVQSCYSNCHSACHGSRGWR